MMGRSLITIGIIMILAGVLITYAPRIPYLGKLPGDFHFKKEGFEIYFPFATSIIISIIITVALYLINRK